MMITSGGVIIRMNAGTIRECGRASQGVILMRLSEDVKVISVARAPRRKRKTSTRQAPQSRKKRRTGKVNKSAEQRHREICSGAKRGRSARSAGRTC